MIGVVASLQRDGGESGIRTHGRVSPTHAFQACSFNHSDISPFDSRTTRLAQGWPFDSRTTRLAQGWPFDSLRSLRAGRASGGHQVYREIGASEARVVPEPVSLSLAPSRGSTHQRPLGRTARAPGKTFGRLSGSAGIFASAW